MQRNTSQFLRWTIHVFLPLALGILIYIVYRPNIIISHLFDVSQQPKIDIRTLSFFKKILIFSVPDFFWAYSFASAMLLLNHSLNFMSHRLMFICVVIVVAASEIIQLFIPDFTFSIADTVLVVVACCLSAFLNRRP